MYIHTWIHLYIHTHIRTHVDEALATKTVYSPPTKNSLEEDVRESLKRLEAKSKAEGAQTAVGGE